MFFILDRLKRERETEIRGLRGKLIFDFHYLIIIFEFRQPKIKLSIFFALKEGFDQQRQPSKSKIAFSGNSEIFIKKLKFATQNFGFGKIQPFLFREQICLDHRSGQL